MMLFHFVNVQCLYSEGAQRHPVSVGLASDELVKSLFNNNVTLLELTRATRFHNDHSELKYTNIKSIYPVSRSVSTR